MKQTTIDKLKVGDRLADGEFSKYGRFINIYVHAIKITKARRYKITLKRDYENKDTGIIEGPCIRSMHNGAVVGHTEVTLF